MPYVGSRAYDCSQMKFSRIIFTSPSKIFSSLLRRYGSFIPDRLYLKLLYYFEMGRKLNIKNPASFTEKIQWLKLYDRRAEYTRMVDKYAVKSYVSGIIGKEYIIPTLGVWDRFEEIDFDRLPSSFVLKTTHGGGSCGVVVVPDKSAMNKKEARLKLERSMHMDGYTSYREWPYRDVPRRIIAEEFLSDNGRTDLTDYKWYCFNGEPRFCQVIRDRNSKETIDFYDIEWRHMEFVGLNSSAKNGAVPVDRPEKLGCMLDICRKLSKDIPFLRVDLYDVDNHLYFGELTFYPAAGLGSFTPGDTDYKLGELLKI